MGFSLFKKNNSVYFPGCLTYFKFNGNFELYKKIFSKLDIDFKIINNKICCGLPALESGYETEARKLARRNLEIFKEEGVNEIILTSPCCYKMFLQNYPDFLPDWDIKIRNIWQEILNRLESKPKLIKNKPMESATYQDSCYLGRYCGIYNEPRKILELIGYEIKEMPDSKEDSICCGSCGGLERINPQLADRIAKEKILQAKRIKIKKIIVSSFDSYKLLKKNSAGTDIEILEFSEVLARALDIEIKKSKLFQGPEEEQIILDLKQEEKSEDRLEENTEKSKEEPWEEKINE